MYYKELEAKNMIDFSQARPDHRKVFSVLMLMCVYVWVVGGRRETQQNISLHNNS